MKLEIEAHKTHLVNNTSYLYPSQGSRESVYLSFIFDESWEGYDKVVAFQYFDSPEIKREIGSDPIAVPNFVLAKPSFKVRVIGINESKALIYQSDVLTICVRR